MTSRSRSRDRRVALAGTIQQWFPPAYVDTSIQRSTAYVGSWADCSDTHGERTTDNPFLVRHMYERRPTLDGVYVNAQGKKTVEVKSWTLNRVYIPMDPRAVIPAPLISEWLGLAQRAAAETNPSVPTVSLPTFIGELKDMPGQLRESAEVLRDLGRAILSGRKLVKSIASGLTAKSRDRATKAASKGLSLAEKTGKRAKWLANQNLGYRFGWKPLVADLTEFLKLHRAIAARFRALFLLRGGYGLKRRLSLGSVGTSIDHGNATAFSELGVILSYHFETKFYAKSWLTTRWRLKSSVILPETNEELLRLAEKLVLGMTSYEAMAAGWELLPWSWLVDWGWNIGNFIAANNNSLGLDLESICWCRTCTSSVDVRRLTAPPSWLILNGWWAGQVVTKERVPLNTYLVYVPPFLACLPIMSTGRWSILASILAQRVIR